MSRWKAVVCLLFAFMAATIEPAAAQVQKNDFVIMLVTGNAVACTEWGFSGEAAIYAAAPVNNQPSLPYVKVIEKVPVERRSARKVVTCGLADYGTNGHIPPGVYAMFYRRFDTTNPPLPEPGRHRLGLQEVPCNTPGACNGNLSTPTGVVRTGLQFHVTANDTSAFDPSISEGCITMRQAQWNLLFPKAFTTAATSPLVAFNTTTDKHAGSGRVLVFVTDVTDPKVQKAQVAFFDLIRQTGFAPLAFEDGTALKSLSTSWRSQK
jgi:hypothetical protein